MWLSAISKIAMPVTVSAQGSTDRQIWKFSVLVRFGTVLVRVNHHNFLWHKFFHINYFVSFPQKFTSFLTVFNFSLKTVHFYATVVSCWHLSFQQLQAAASKSLSLYGILAQYFISFIIYKIWCQYRNSFSTLFLLWTGPFSGFRHLTLLDP